MKPIEASEQLKKQLAEDAKVAMERYESGILSMAPKQNGGPNYDYIPRVHMDESIFFNFFNPDEIEVEVRRDCAYEYEYQATYEGVTFFCLSQKLYEGFVA